MIRLIQITNDIVSLRCIPIFSLMVMSTMMAQIDAAIILSNQPLYTNELFRIGGSRRLRGFDEESSLAHGMLL